MVLTFIATIAGSLFALTMFINAAGTWPNISIKVLLASVAAVAPGAIMDVRNMS